MTANAMSSDREACLAAGMNAHVGKPFDLDHLVSVLLQSTGRQVVLGQAAAQETSSLPSSVVDAAVAAGVQLNAAIERMGGRQDIYARMLRGFESELAGAGALLQGQVEARDLTALARALHTYKGGAATLGLTALAASQSEQELRVRRASADDLPLLTDIAAAASRAIEAARPALAALNRAFDRLAAQALDKSAEPEAPPEGEGNYQQLKLQLDLVGELLRHSDMAALDALVRLPRPFPAGLKEPLQALEASATELNFDLALSQCAQVIKMLES